ncbi:MAG: glycosyltransferase family 2 protein [Wenzhouxiangellaceae bacterium]
MRKLIIQIPCYNEAETLPVTLSELPKQIDGFDAVEWLVIDDGSTDGTAKVAAECGVHHVARHSVNRGLAAAFMTGIETAVALGADVIVNTDADNQYEGRDIEALTRPILAGQAEMVVGARPILQTEHFSWLKKRLQVLGTAVVRLASNTEVQDAPSGFRAFTRDTAMRLNVFNTYTYTLETLIQAGHSNIRVTSVPVRTNPDLRPSRLVRSIGRYVWRSASTIVRVFATYRPLTFFWLTAAFFGLVGLGFGSWYLYHRAIGFGAGHVQSAILAASCVTIALVLFMSGFIADLVAVNRRLLQDVEWRLKRMEYRSGGPAAAGNKPDAKAAKTTTEKPAPKTATAGKVENRIARADGDSS